MDTRLKYQSLIKEILLKYAQLKPAHGQIDSRIVFDDEHGSYTLMEVGWQGKTHIHGCVVHIDLIDDKIWIQYDGTEEGVAAELLESGVSNTDIILGFRHPKLRPYTGLATA